MLKYEYEKSVLHTTRPPFKDRIAFGIFFLSEIKFPVEPYDTNN